MLPAPLTIHRAKLSSLFAQFVPPTLQFVAKECASMIETGPAAVAKIARVRMLMDLVTGLTALQPELSARLIDNVFLFSIVWALGGILDAPSRLRFDAFLRKLARGESPPGYATAQSELAMPALELTHLWPAGSSVFDFIFSTSREAWEPWISASHSTEALQLDKGVSNLLVPTIDTARYIFLAEVLVQQRRPCLLVGPTGVGKTAYVRHLLASLPASEWAAPITMAFSGSTSAQATQAYIDGQLSKRCKGVFGTPDGKRCVVFIDDLNLPALEVYGAQPTIELLRQALDTDQGWYNRTEHTFRRLEGLSFVCAMGPPGGGRNQISLRALRHFDVLGVPSLEDATLQQIFAAMLEPSLACLPAEYQRLSSALAPAIVDVFSAACKGLLPTPSRSHYTFNTRDIAVVVQGILLVPPTDFEQPSDLIMLCASQCVSILRLVDRALLLCLTLRLTQRLHDRDTSPHRDARSAALLLRSPCGHGGPHAASCRDALRLP